MALAFIILIIEFTVVAVCVGIMIFVRLSRNWRERQTKKRRKALKEIYANALLKQEVLHLDQIDPDLRNYEDLLSTVESFDRFFLDPIWQENKKYLIDTFLKKNVKQLLQSSSWRDRHLGLRCVALNPKELVDEQIIQSLLNDPKFIVRVLAATSMIHSERKNLLLPVLKRMIQEPPMGRYAYRDLLINGGNHIFKWLEEIASQQDDPEIIASCLDILSTKTSANLLPLAGKHIHSGHLDCQLAAIKIFGSIPSQESIKHLTEILKDKNPKIRAEAAGSLGKLLAYSSIPELSLTLKDPEWGVRLQAAIALKGMGEKGRDVLYKQKPQQNADAYEIANYILALP